LTDTRITVLFHPLGPDSYELVKGLMNRGYTTKIDLLPAFTPGLFIQVFPWSTPSVYTLTGQPLALSPLTPEEIIEMAEGRDFSSRIYDDEDMFITSIQKSTYASALSLLWGSFEPLLYNCGFLTPALRLKLRKVRCSDVQSKLKHNIKNLYERYWKSIAKSLAYSLVRGMYIASGFSLTLDDIENLTYRTILLWLYSKATVGIVGAPMKVSNKEVADYISEYISSRSYSILETVQRDIYKILSDRQYIELVNREIGWYYPFLKRSGNI